MVSFSAGNEYLNKFKLLRYSLSAITQMVLQYKVTTYNVLSIGYLKSECKVLFR